MNKELDRNTNNLMKELEDVYEILKFYYVNYYVDKKQLEKKIKVANEVYMILKAISQNPNKMRDYLFDSYNLRLMVDDYDYIELNNEYNKGQHINGINNRLCHILGLVFAVENIIIENDETEEIARLTKIYRKHKDYKKIGKRYDNFYTWLGMADGVFLKKTKNKNIQKLYKNF